MKKLTLAFTLLSSLALVGTAAADNDRGRHGDDGRAPIVDHRLDQPVAPTYAPVFVPPPAPPAFADRGAQFRPATPAFAGNWDLLTAMRAPARRGTMMIPLPARGSYDQLKLIASDRGLDIVAIELTYGRGRTEVLRPQADGVISLDLGRGKVRSVAVRYVNRGAGRGAMIKVLAKDDADGGAIGHGGWGQGGRDDRGGRGDRDDRAGHGGWGQNDDRAARDDRDDRDGRGGLGGMNGGGMGGHRGL